MQNNDTTFRYSRYFLILTVILTLVISAGSSVVMNIFSGYYGIFSILLMIAATALGFVNVTPQAEPVVNPHYELFILGGSIVALYLLALIYAIFVVIFRHKKHPRGIASFLFSLFCVSGGLFTLYSIFMASQAIYREGKLIFH